MKKLLLLICLLAVAFASEMFAQSAQNKLFPLNNEKADLLCTVAQSHLKDLALLLVCGGEVKNQPLELIDNSTGMLGAINCGSTITIWYPFFRPLGMHRLHVEIKEKNTTSSKEPKSVIELIASTHSANLAEDCDSLERSKYWVKKTYQGVFEQEEAVTFSPQEFEDFLRYCARRKSNLKYDNIAQ
jgi:hypothetical protein